jgi:hypothetical protein
MTAQEDELLRNFNSGLSKLRSEILSNLGSLDLLNQEAVDSFIATLNQRIVVAQHDFVDFVHRAIGPGSSGGTKALEVNAVSSHVFPEVAGALGGGAAAAILVKVIRVPVTKWWLIKQQLPIAEKIAQKAKTGRGMVVAAAALVAAAAAGGAVYLYRLPHRRKQVREAILASFDNDVIPHLRIWAQQVVERTTLERQSGSDAFTSQY